MSLGCILQGADRSSGWVKVNSIAIEDSLSNRTTLSIRLKDPAYALGIEIGQDMIISDGPNVVFRGSIDASTREVPGLSQIPPVWDLQCVDFTALSNKALVVKSYEDTLAGAMIKDMVNSFASEEGIDVDTYVEDGLLIHEARFTYVSLYDAIQDIADRIGYIWWIDFEKRLHFCPRDFNIAPIALSSTSYNFRNLKIKQDRANYVNRQYVRGGMELTDERIDFFKGNYSNKTFNLALPCGKLPSVAVDSGSGYAAKTVGIQGLDNGKDFYWNKGSTQIVQDDEATALNSGQTLRVTYQGQVPIIVMAQLDDEIAARKAIEGGSGVYESVIEDSSIESSALALDKANALLRKNGHISKVITFETESSGLWPGQMVGIALPEHGVDGFYLISSITIRDIEGLFLRYTVKCVEGDSEISWVDFYKKLAASGHKYVIRENEVVRNLRTSYHELKCEDQLTVVVS